MSLHSIILRRLLLCLLSLVTLVAAMASGSTPTAPTTASSRVLLPGARPADLTACLGGSGDASCSNASVGGAPLNSAGPAVVGAPINLTASVSGQTVVLSWTAPATGDPVTGYVIEAGTAPGLSNLVPGAAIPVSNSLTVPEVPFGQYFVRIRATGAAGPGAPSNEIVVTVGGCAGPPQNLTAVSASAGTLSLGWQPPVSGGPTSYIISAGNQPGLSNLATFDTGNSATGFEATNVPAGSYYVRVSSRSSCGPSAPSNEVFVVVSATGECAGPPQNLTVASQSAGTISLEWLPPLFGSPTSYILFAGNEPGLSNVATFDTGSNATGVVVPNVPAGSYYVRVSSQSSCGLSAPSNEVLVFAVGVSGDVQVSVSWDAPSDVDLHVVEPSGEEIYYGNPGSSTGGQLDVDSNAACNIDGRQIENIRWPGSAPSGTYIVRVDYWDSCGVGRTNYLVTVRQGSSTRTFTGSFTGDGDNGGEGSGVTITTFVQAASDALTEGARRFFRAPSLFTPSPKKLKTSGAR